MRWHDATRFAWGGLRGFRSRALLMVLSMAIGVGAVVVLTALGEGARGYVVNQFSALGTNLLIVFPGRTETGGTGTGMLVGQTPRDLTLEDALALTRAPGIAAVAPLTIGTALMTYGGRSRETIVLGTSWHWKDIRGVEMQSGSFLPAGDARAATPVCVIGRTVRDELFGSEVAVGRQVRIGDRRYRVIGVMTPHGESLGFNMDEVVIVPVAAAQALFDISTLLRILVEARSRSDIPRAKAQAEAILQERHDGERDVTVVTQDAVLETFDRILRALTLAVGGIAGISLAVSGILVMNVMLIAVSQRRQEIGLLKAVGATRAQIRVLFLIEALLLAMLGAAAGLALGLAGSALIRRLYPALPAYAPSWAIAAALLTAALTAIVFTLLPARRAARLDPVLALSRR
ncbi:MAG: ABC transporter permease [Burkholderiales bacterium]|nr:ABC transporter permease [Burkholderiales bacterium]